MKKLLRYFIIFSVLFSFIFVNAGVNNSYLNDNLPIKSENHYTKKAKIKNNIKLSYWALYDINDSQFYGIFPFERNKENMDFTKNLTLDDAKYLYKNTKDKLNSLNINTNDKEFNFKNLNRNEVISSILFLVNKDESFSQKFFYGLQDKDYLNKKISLQESICLYTRACKEIIGEENKESQGYFYKVEKGNNKIYLLGSIHLGIKEMYPIRSEIIKALNESKEIYFEIDPTDPELSKIYKTNMYYDSKGNLENDLGQTYNRLLPLLLQRGIPKERINKIRPWAIYNMLSLDEKNIYGSSYGIENYFSNLALINNIPIKELESAKFQAKLLKNFDTDMYASMIEDLISEIEINGYKNNNQSLYLTQKDWIDGNTKNLKALTEDDGYSQAQVSFDKALLDKRDIDMAKKIDKLLKEENNKTIFVVVGAAHLVPQTSARGILEDMGYKVIKL